MHASVFIVYCPEYAYCFYIFLVCVCLQGDIDRVSWQSLDQDGGGLQTATGLKGNSLMILTITLLLLILQ